MKELKIEKFFKAMWKTNLWLILIFYTSSLLLSLSFTIVSLSSGARITTTGAPPTLEMCNKAAFDAWNLVGAQKIFLK